MYYFYKYCGTIYMVSISFVSFERQDYICFSFLPVPGTVYSILCVPVLPLLGTGTWTSTRLGTNNGVVRETETCKIKVENPKNAIDKSNATFVRVQVPVILFAMTIVETIFERNKRINKHF
jgi:hypothetical protein